MKYEKINTQFKRDTDGTVVLLSGDTDTIGPILVDMFSMREFGSVNRWSVTEKIDGMNMRVIYTKDGVEFRGRTDRAQMPTSLVKVLQDMFPLSLMSQVFDLEKAETIILYGEGYGSGIQKGGKYRSDQSFILFDVNIDGIWISEEDVTRFASELMIERAPVLGVMTISGIIDLVISRPKSLVSERDDVVMEGVVCRSDPLMLDRMGRRVIFKLKDRDFKKIFDAGREQKLLLEKILKRKESGYKTSDITYKMYSDVI